MRDYSKDFTPLEEIEWCSERIKELFPIFESEYTKAREAQREAARLAREAQRSSRVCSYCGSKNYYAKGLCKNCLERLRRTGSVEPKPKKVKLPPPPKPHWTEVLTRAVTGEFENPPEDLEQSILYVLNTLKAKEKSVIIARYKDEMTLEACGEFLSLSREWVRQIQVKALRELRRPTRKMFFTIGLNAVRKKEDEERHQRELRLKAEKDAIEKKKIQLSIDIDCLNPSVRAFNCLKRSHIDTIWDLVVFLGEEMNIEKLLKIRNLGRRTALEIESSLKDYLSKIEGDVNNAPTN